MIPVPGLRLFPGYLDKPAQQALLEQVRLVLAAAPPRHYRVPGSGRSMSVAMSNAGPLGWVADGTGYRYSPTDPDSGLPWPPLPPLALALWRDLAGYPADPECCLINYYAPMARMSLHRDEDEAALDAPILNISLGDTALFRLGGPQRRDPTRSFALDSGTLMLFGGAARHCYHGVDRIRAGSSRLLPEGGRLNLTLRRVSQP